MSEAASYATDRAPLCAGPDPHPRPARRFKVPAGAVDTHAHVIGLPPRYPLVTTRSYTAPEASPAAYLAMLDAVGMAHGVLVQVSVHGTDNGLLVEALGLGKGRLRGICVISPDVSDRELEQLAAAGVVGARLNVLFGGGIGFDAIDTLARRIRPFGWHLQFLMDVRDIAPIAGKLAKLPVPWVIDHMGHLPADAALKNDGFQTMLRLLHDTDGWVKLSGAYRVSVAGPPYADTIAMACALVEARPDRLVWGSDWPHVSHKGPMPNVGDLLDLLADWVRDPAVRDRILADNAHRLYGFKR
jgi:predicted TIM-barrel fold metal-dependent hydrolase